MKESIKKRIEAVRRGEVPEGYKRTDLGVMPEEWSDSTIGKVIAFHSEKSTINNEYPVLTSARSGLVLQTEYFEDQVTREENAGYNVIPYGYVTYRSRSDDGRFTFNQNQIIERGIVSCFYPVFRIIEDLAEPTFVLSYLNNHLGRQIVKEIVGTSQLVLSEKKLLELRLPCPPLAEQQKIAEILTTCDRVIELKQKLLEEKRRQKQWLLQKLLDPNSGVRLPGFEESRWTRCRIGDVADIYSGGTPDTKTESFWDGDVLWCTPSDITCAGKYIDRTETTISELGLQKSSAVLMPVGSVLMCSRATIGPRSIAKVPIATNQGFKNFVCKETLYNEFLYYALETVLPDLLKKAAGNTFKEVSKSDLSNSMIDIPGLDEQKAIANRLIMADRDIELSGQELEAWQQKKKALMQLLLTGLVRVSA